MVGLVVCIAIWLTAYSIVDYVRHPEEYAVRAKKRMEDKKKAVAGVYAIGGLMVAKAGVSVGDEETIDLGLSIARAATSFGGATAKDSDFGLAPLPEVPGETSARPANSVEPAVWIPRVP